MSDRPHGSELIQRGSKRVRRQSNRKFSPADMDRAMLAVLACGGNTNAAVARLEAQGFLISAATLKTAIKNTYPERYAELASLHQGELDQQIAALIRQTAHQAVEGTLEGIERTRTELAAGETRDPSAATRNLATAAGIMLDKQQLLTGRPTEIFEHRDAEDILRSLGDKFPGLVVDGTAEELPEAEVID